MKDLLAVICLVLLFFVIHPMLIVITGSIMLGIALQNLYVYIKWIKWIR